ncbi:MAG: GMC family oxidoreductase [Acidobacteriota bacterium]|nr:GMC family oxidoreductase [Acidobacteriota bacterium]
MASRKYTASSPKKTGGKFIIQNPDAFITPHPLGGCPLGSSPADGVVNHLGETFASQPLRSGW